MRLKLTLNIGKADARRLNLKQTAAGAVVDVGPPVSDELLKRGWGVEATEEPAKLKAVPAVEVKAADVKAAPEPPKPPK